ncbi:MAG: hypothetical protein K2Y22_03605 [Candidatus Obscuribacterales bacterium]|nr:hypothetical protein [Candidatus Obscuribacterales bacterium]
MTKRYPSFILSLLFLSIDFSQCSGIALAETTSAPAPTLRGEHGASTGMTGIVPQTDALPGEIKTEFKVVDSAAIDVDITAIRDTSAGAKNDINGKVRAKYIPVRISIINKSGKLLQIPKDGIYFVDSKGEKIPVPSEAEIYKSVKRNGILRALAWGIPIGVISFGFLAVPAFAYSGAHTKVTNGSLKANIAEHSFRGGHLGPESSISKIVFIPKKNGDIGQIALSRVINEEDETMTQKVIGIETTCDMTGEKKPCNKIAKR